MMIEGERHTCATAAADAAAAATPHVLQPSLPPLFGAPLTTTPM